MGIGRAILLAISPLFWVLAAIAVNIVLLTELLPVGAAPAESISAVTIISLFGLLFALIRLQKPAVRHGWSTLATAYAVWRVRRENRSALSNSAAGR